MCDPEGTGRIHRVVGTGIGVQIGTDALIFKSDKGVLEWICLRTTEDRVLYRMGNTGAVLAGSTERKGKTVLPVVVAQLEYLKPACFMPQPDNLRVIILQL